MKQRLRREKARAVIDGLDWAPMRARDAASPNQPERIALDCRKEIAHDSTNKIVLSRFFDAVGNRAKHNEASTDQQRCRRIM